MTAGFVRCPRLEITRIQTIAGAGIGMELFPELSDFQPIGNPLPEPFNMGDEVRLVASLLGTLLSCGLWVWRCHLRQRL